MNTKDKILDAAQSLVQSIGANAMSYQHVSDAVGIRKASIHHHYPTKEDLLDALMDRYAEYFFTLVDGIIASPKTGRSKLEEYVALFEATLREGQQDKACPMGMLGAEVRTIGEGPAERVKTFYLRNDQRLAAIVEEGRRDGSLAFKGSPLTMAGFIFALLEGLMLVARGRQNCDHFRAVTDQLLLIMRP